MAVLGIGLDLCAVDRMDAALARHGDRFEARIFTEAERAYAAGRHNRGEALAARFAAKEATSKALGAMGGADVVGGSLIISCDGVVWPSESGAKATALQTLRATQGAWCFAPAFGVRSL